MKIKKKAEERFDYDFSGWATKANIKCSDGRIIDSNAFKHNDGKIVPLVWNHDHSNGDNVVGKAMLCHTDEGVYTYAQFNTTQRGKNAKEQIKHGDITNLSIYANKLHEIGNLVKDGDIKEVSLVIAGANPGACIDHVVVHGDNGDDISAEIYTDEEILVNEDGSYLSISHSDIEEENQNGIEAVLDTLTDKQIDALYTIVNRLSSLEHSDEDDETVNEALEELKEGLNEEQSDAVCEILDRFVEDDDTEEEDDEDVDDDEEENEEGEENEMKHNVFEKNAGKTAGVVGGSALTANEEKFLSHSEIESIFVDAKRGSLKDAVLKHAQDYGIKNIDILFPDAKNLDTTPSFIKRETGWVSTVLNGTKHTPFSRIRSTHADITADEARAKGYLKGNRKKEEVFTLLKRTTDPQTVYKKQKLDRDDIIDITDFNIVSWIRAEMRLMLDEEIARAILIGDGRLPDAEDKIREQNIRPIYNDDDLYTVKVVTKAKASDDSDSKAKDFIRTMIKSRKLYKGSGNPVLFTTDDVITDCLLLEDTTGRRLYNSVDELARILRVSKIEAVPVMEGMTGVKGGELMGVVVNLIDYNVGADKGGRIATFDDFDIDFNQYKYLMETRISGALVKPFSALAIETAIA